MPEILAAIIIANHPTQYGFDDITLDPPVLTDTVTINYSVDLRLVSDLVGAPVDELMALNPSLLRMATPPDASFDLHLPAGTATLFEQRIALIPESEAQLVALPSRDRGRYAGVGGAHVSRDGGGAGRSQPTGARTTASPASRHWWCRLRRRPHLRLHTLLYTTRRGDTLVTIADRFGVSLDQLRRWNKIPSGIKVEPGRPLHVAEPATVQRSTTKHRGTNSKSSSAKTHAPNSAAQERGPVFLRSNQTQCPVETLARRGQKSSGALLHTCLFVSIACKLLLQLLPHVELNNPQRQANKHSARRWRQ